MKLPLELRIEIEEIGALYERNPVSGLLSRLSQYCSKQDPEGFEFKQALRLTAELLDLLRNPRGLQDLVPDSISSLEDLDQWHIRLRRAANQLDKFRNEVDAEYRCWKAEIRR